IRDKIAASKKRGMWMGGLVPLGYDCVERRLVINPAEARSVREIFRQYLRLGSVRKLTEFLDSKRIRSKVRTSVAGRTGGGAAFSRGALYHLLNNRIYVGEIPHKSQSYPGIHRPVVRRELWVKVAALLQENDRAHRVGKSHSSPSLLSGKLFDSKGARFTPTHAVKNAKRYRYYTSQTVIRPAGARPIITRFPAEELEQVVRSQILGLLQSPEKWNGGMKDRSRKDVAVECAQELAREWPKGEISKQHEFIRNTLKRVVLGKATVRIEIDKTKLLATLLAENAEALASLSPHKSEFLTVTGNFQVLRRGGEIRVLTPQNDSRFEGTPVPALTNAVARARDWYERIVAGEVNSIDQLAKSAGLTGEYVRRVLQCACLSPRVTEAVLTGKHRPNLTLKEILCGVPLRWQHQEEQFLRLQ
ncbi:MAG: recombinase family protein, partial [Candidatus Acidiferrales bacterium]